MHSEHSPSPRKDDEEMNAQGYKELIVKLLIHDQHNLIRNEESQKTVVMESNEGDRLIDYLELNELNMRYCRLCDFIIPDHMMVEHHLAMKVHKKQRDELLIREIEDQIYSILLLHSTPGDIDKELIKEKEKALKRKVKRIKAQMCSQAESHENAIYCPGKEITSQNKKRF